MTPLYTYQVTPPGMATFLATITEADDGRLVVYSNKSGVWAPHPSLHAEDLMRPEYDLNEWDVYEVKPATLGELEDGNTDT
jgi:hypothetical protein